MADTAGRSGSTALQVTPLTVPVDPVRRMAPRRRFVMAPHAVVLAMAEGAALPVRAGGHAVSLVPPVVRVVTGRPRGMA